MQLNSRLTTTQTVSPQLFQLMKILQLNTLELGCYLVQQATENPVLDLDLLYRAPAVSRIEHNMLSDNRKTYASEMSDGNEDNDEADDVPDQSSTQETIQDYLIEQISVEHLSPLYERICRYLIDCVDSKGYLHESAADTADFLQADEAEVSFCLQHLRSLQPAGICSENLVQCLLVQAKPLNDPLLSEIIEHHLPQIASGHYRAVASATGACLSAVKAASEKLAKLNPNPASEFFSGDNHYIEPDIIVSVHSGDIEINFLSNYSSYLNINSYYRELYSSTPDMELRSYLGQKLSAANLLINNIQLYEHNLDACIQAVADCQREYFRDPAASAAPMLMQDIAERIGVSSSTISRIVSGKYIQCCHGVLPLRALFSADVSHNSSRKGCSADEVKNAIRQIIESEDKSAPLSDAQIADVLSHRNLNVSRRAIANYRSELNIPGVFVRKKK